MNHEQAELLERAVAEHGQAAVARQMGYSASAVNQALHGKYQGSLDNLLRRVEEVYGNTVIECPVLGEITMGRCAHERKRLPRLTNPQARRLTVICPACEHYRE